jgi:galactokinase
MANDHGSIVSELEAEARRWFRGNGREPTVMARAPGRVELLGNHTDHNGGLVLATAIDRHTVVAGRPVAGRSAVLRSLPFPDPEAFDLDAIEPSRPGAWGQYVRGVVWALSQARRMSPASGFEAVLTGNVPLGAGLSSSASLEAALGLFLLAAGVFPSCSATTDADDPARLELAQILRRAENEFVGVASGLLDQFTVLMGRSGQALTLDCRSLAFERLPLGASPPAIVICDSKTSRRLADGMYNRRREECDRVVTFFRDRLKPRAVNQLRDVTWEDLQSAWDDLDPVGRRRARHVLTENDRVRRGAEALRSGDLAAFGRLMSESHASSRDDFENSSEALDTLISVAEHAPGFLGGKLSGAGWAGCTVNLVVADQADAFAEAVRAGYARRAGTRPDIHICQAADGASARPVS